MRRELRKRHPPSLSPRALAIAGSVAFVLATGLFLAIAWQISTEGSPLLGFDERASAWMESQGHPAVIAFFLAVTHLNSIVAIGAWSVAFSIVLARLREWYWLLTLALSVGGAMLLNLVLKIAFERLRPRFDNPLLEHDTYSFPSGHTAAAVAFYGVLAAFVVSRYYDRRRRAACVAGAIGAVLLVALSRVYLGAHYPSDVLAAMCSSTVWLVLCLTGGHALVRGKLDLKWLLVGALLILALCGAVLLPLGEWSERFQATIAGMGLVTGIALFCAVNVIGSLLLVPVWIFALAAGAELGFGWGLVAAMLGSWLGALAAFVLVRHVLRRPLERAARRNAAFKAVDAAVAKEGWKIVALLRMSPVVPAGVKSYFLGLTRVKLLQYAAASAAGMFPLILLKVYIGAIGRDALSEGGPLNWALLGAGVAATVGVTLLLVRSARKKLTPFFP